MGMARRNRIALPPATLDDWRRFYDFSDFDHFLEVYVLAASCMRTPEDYAAMVERVLYPGLLSPRTSGAVLVLE
jgi:hypothetical protein